MVHTLNFLEQQQRSGDDGEHTPNHRHPSRSFPYIFVGVVALLVIYLIVAALGAGRVVASSLDARDELMQAQAAAEALEFDNAQAALDRAQEDIVRAQKGLIVLAPLRILPWVGDQVRAVDSVLSASERLIPSLKDVVSIAAEVVEVVDRAKELSSIPADEELTYLTMPASIRRDLLNKLHQSLPELERVRARLTLAEEDVRELDQLSLAEPVRKAVEPFRVLLPELSETVDFLVPAVAVLPEFAGLGEPSRFLLLFENNTELRPGGGFIGTFGTLVTEDGTIVALTSADSYEFDGPATDLVTLAPPAPIQKYIGVNKWYFRDANWSPDFSVSAQKSLQLLIDEQRLLGQNPASYDGVIAITPTFASHLIDIVGPVTIDGQTFTSENFAELLEYQVEFGFAEQGIPRPQRKDIVGRVVQEVTTRLMNLPISSLSSVVDASLSSLREKQVLLWSAEAETQEVLAGAGWAGVLTAGDDDSVLVVDANMASLKSDPAVERSLRYRLRQNEEGRLVAQMKVTYKHTGTFDWKTTRYRTYTRLYVPLGSELIRGEGAMENDKLLNPSMKPGVVDVSEELGYTVFGGFISIEPGETRSLEFSYYLPETIAEAVQNGSYDLTVHKQAGAFNHDLTVDVDFGKPLKSATPAEAETQYGDTKYFLNTILDQDKEVNVRF